MSKAHNRAALMQVIIFRENLDGLNVESLSRSYGVPATEVIQLLENEKRKRAAQ